LNDKVETLEMEQKKYKQLQKSFTELEHLFVENQKGTRAFSYGVAFFVGLLWFTRVAELYFQ